MIPLAEVTASSGAAVPLHNDKVFPKSNKGSSMELTVTVRVNLPMHCSAVAFGVNV